MLEFQQAQIDFAAHLRNPLQPAPPGIEDRRLKIYRELFYNNIQGVLAQAFPVLRAISSESIWHDRVRDFYARHSSQAPQFHQIAEEFLKFLAEERGVHEDDPPFLSELCHYEWVELALQVSELEIPTEGVDANGNLLDGCPLISPLAWPFAYDFPVHRIAPYFLPMQASEPPSYLIVYRDRHDKVGFMEINAVTARLMQLLDERQHSTGRAVLEQISQELGHPSADVVVLEGAKILQDLHLRDIILGTRISI